MYTRISRETCLRETGKAPIKTGWAETDKGQPGKPNVRARWVAKEYKTHARPELHAPTPPLEALKVVLSEIDTCTRRGKVVALVEVRRAYFYAPARQSVRHARRCTKLERGARIYAQQSTIDERKRVPVRVERVTSRERTLLQPCMEMTSQLVEKGQQWTSSSE